MKKLCLMILMGSIGTVCTWAQDAPHPRTGLLDGSFGASTNGRAIFLNLGGPNLSYTRPNLRIALSFFPSMRFQKEPNRPMVSPTLGGGVQITHRRTSLLVPLYFVSNRWTVSAGLGFKLTKQTK